MTQGALRLLQGFLSLLKLTDMVTSRPGLAVTLWLWFYLTLPYDSALGLWLATLIPLLLANHEPAKDKF